MLDIRSYLNTSGWVFHPGAQDVDVHALMASLPKAPKLPHEEPEPEPDPKPEPEPGPKPDEEDDDGEPDGDEIDQ